MRVERWRDEVVGKKIEKEAKHMKEMTKEDKCERLAGKELLRKEKRERTFKLSLKKKKKQTERKEPD